MNDLKIGTYIAVLIASIMAIVWLGIEFYKPYSNNCERAKQLANNYFLVPETASAYANYYEAFCD